MAALICILWPTHHGGQLQVQSLSLAPEGLRARPALGPPECAMCCCRRLCARLSLLRRLGARNWAQKKKKKREERKGRGHVTPIKQAVTCSLITLGCARGPLLLGAVSSVARSVGRSVGGLVCPAGTQLAS